MGVPRRAGPELRRGRGRVPCPVGALPATGIHRDTHTPHGFSLKLFPPGTKGGSVGWGGRVLAEKPKSELGFGTRQKVADARLWASGGWAWVVGAGFRHC